MAQTQHTPGPWTTGADVPDDYDTEWRADIDGPRDGVATSQPIFADNETIALVVWEGWIDRTGIANARLIAAAPDLLAALKEATARLHLAMVTSGTDFEFADLGVAKYRAAIAKAEGSTNA